MMQQTIEQKLRALEPQVCIVENESRMHNVPADAESHFKVTIVAQQFEGDAPLARHRRVYQLLADELAGGVHALAVHAFTPDEWRAKNQTSVDSPPCLGGSAADKKSVA